MNTRAIIIFFEDGVQIVDEFLSKQRGLVQARPRYYYYAKMSAASYYRLVNLHYKPESIVRLTPCLSIRKFTTMIYWKRGNGRHHERNTN